MQHTRARTHTHTHTHSHTHTHTHTHKHACACASFLTILQFTDVEILEKARDKHNSKEVITSHLSQCHPR